MAWGKEQLYKIGESGQQDVHINVGDFVINVGGTLYWKKASGEASTDKLSQRWKDWLQSINGLEAQGVIDVDLTETPIPGRGNALSSAVGNYFEYCFWTEMLKQLSGNDAIMDGEATRTKEAGKVARMTFTSTSNKIGSRKGVLISGTATENFAARGSLTDSPYAELIRLGKTEEIKSIQDAARSTAGDVISKLIEELKRKQVSEIHVDVAAGSNPLGDIIIEALNKSGKPITLSNPHLELKAYGSSTVTFFTLQDKDSFARGGMTFAKFLYDSKEFWPLTLETAVWANRVLNDGYKKYVCQLTDKGEDGKAIYSYLLSKGGHQFDPGKKRMVVCNTSNGKATISIDLATALDRAIEKGTLKMDWGAGRTDFNIEIEQKLNPLGYLSINPDNIYKESNDSKEKTPQEGPDWVTTFRFKVTKLLYGS